MDLSQKKIQILKAQAFSFPMIYIMSGYEKIDFMTFLGALAPLEIARVKNNIRKKF